MARAVGWCTAVVVSVGIAACGGDPAGGDGGPVNCTTPCACADHGPPDYSRAGTGRAAEGSGADQQTALVRANRWRTAAGIAPFNAAALIETAAGAHAHFLATNAQRTCWAQSAHRQTAGCPSFTGVSTGDRLTAAGYAFGNWAEVINWESDPERAVDGWMWSVYHRLGVMSWRTTETGYGRERGPFGTGTAFHNVMDFATPRGATPTAPANPAVFPLPGQTDVPRRFAGYLEGPTPPGPGGRTPWPSGVYSGTVVSVHFPSAMWTVSNHQLFDARGGACTELPHTYTASDTDPNLRGGADAFLYADAPLEPGGSYVARVEGTSNGQPWARTWAFTTASP